jgi:hypothetical protein
MMMHEDPLADTNPLHTLAYGDDRAGRLVSENDGCLGVHVPA